MDVAEILVGAVLADAVHERGDLQLRAVRFDASQLVLKDIVVAADFQIRSDRGRNDRLISVAPPSEPDGRVSRIRLSG